MEYIPIMTQRRRNRKSFCNADEFKKHIFGLKAKETKKCRRRDDDDLVEFCKL
jgi:hypothetical protein